MSYTIKELARDAGVNEKTCLRWIEQGLPTLLGGKKPILMRGSDIKEFLRKNN
jgi:predicted site-specific integrase-resolvase